MPKAQTLIDSERELAQWTALSYPPLCEPVSDEEPGALRCHACGHHCLIRPGKQGICKVRFNVSGTLRVPFGYVATTQLDPIEKKPFFHVTPGAKALSFGMLGCDFHCGYCQNWDISQALRDPAVSARPKPTDPQTLVKIAKEQGASMLTSTYNEPLITAEWSRHVFQTARAAGLKTSFVSNGNATPEALEHILPWLDCYKIDLKTFQDKGYRELGGQLKHVLWSIKEIHAHGTWLEIVSLLIPGFNDSDNELRQMAEFLASVSPDIPWHVTAFHEDYKMHGMGNTPAQTLLRAAHLGRQAGLRYVYAGNLPGSVDDFENTRCPDCQTVLVERVGYHVKKPLLKNGACPACSKKIPGIWT